MPSGLISTSSGSVGARRMSAHSLGKGVALSPWKERVQSMRSSVGFAGEGGVSRRSLRVGVVLGVEVEEDEEEVVVGLGGVSVDVVEVEVAGLVLLVVVDW